jgi:hypothetical protein
VSQRFIFQALMLFAFGASQADASGLPTGAQNSVHLGGAWTPGNPQLLMGFDSRLTQSISVDVGGFFAPTAATDAGGSDPWVLRHGLYVEPGVRIPHRNKSEFKWDLIVRAGFGPVWVADGASRFEQQISPGLNGGGDLMFRYQDWGLRFEGRMWYLKPFSKYDQMEMVTVVPQVGASMLYQF